MTSVIFQEIRQRVHVPMLYTKTYPSSPISVILSVQYMNVRTEHTFVGELGLTYCLTSFFKFYFNRLSGAKYKICDKDNVLWRRHWQQFIIPQYGWQSVFHLVHCKFLTWNKRLLINWDWLLQQNLSNTRIGVQIGVVYQDFA